MRVVLATVDRSLPRISGRAGKRREDELLDLAPAAANRDWPGVELLLRYVAADFSGSGFEQRRLARDSNRLGQIAEFQCEVDG